MVNEFHLFPKLPVELRRAVWRHCLPSRVVELDVPYNELVGKGTSCQLAHTTSRNTRPPVISRVCRESREVALEDCYEDPDPDPDRPGWLASNTTEGVLWLRPSTDIVHLNWWPDYDGLYDSTGDPIPFLLWLAASSRGASITADLLHGFDNEYTGGHRNEIFPLLEDRKDYLVCLKMVSIHVPMARALDSGLFGRLGEEPIQCVDAFDQDTIRKYQQLWTLAAPPEDREPAEFFELVTTNRLRERIQQWSEAVEKLWLWNKYFQAQDEEFPEIGDPDAIWLRPPDDDEDDEDSDPFSSGVGPRYTPNKDHPWVKEILAEMPRFRPTIMFRHCVLKCWLPDPLKKGTL